MRPDTPVAHLHTIARSDPDRTFIATSSESFTYGDISAMVEARTHTVASDHGPNGLTPIPTALDVATIVELLAVSSTGRTPVPYSGPQPHTTGSAPAGDAIAVQTSGSGGDQRFVRLTHANIAAAVAASEERLANTAADRWLACLPLNHVGGLSIIWRTLAVGGSVSLGPFDRDLSSLITETRPTIASMVPTMVTRVLNDQPELLVGLRFLLIGGGPVPDGLVARAQDAGVAVRATYGMTEATSQIATGTREKPTRLVPLDGVRITTIDDDGTTLGVGELGRLVLDGPTISPGFLGEPPRHGPHVTSDVGVIDEDGSIRVLGRSDDIVMSGGENVSLGAVGAAIGAFPSVSAGAAIGVPDDEWGTAVIGVAATSLGVDDLDALARERLPRHARPKRWVTVERLPLLGNGKPDMRAIRDLVEPD